MLRAFKTILHHADDHAQCRRPRRCIPSLPESASCLEHRVLLSAAGGKAHAAEIAQNPADTKTGKEVTNLFESTLGTNPTGARLTRLAHELRGGLSVTALRKELTAGATAHHGAQARASTKVVVIGGKTPARAAALEWSSARGTMNPFSVMQVPSAPRARGAGPMPISQVPGGMRISLSFAPGPTRSISVSTGSPAAPSMSGSRGPTSTMGGMSPTSGMSTSATGTMSSTPATSAGMGTPGMLPMSPMPVAPAMSTPMWWAGM
jgi:hypothetical protein